MLAAGADRIGIGVTRTALVIVLIWIGCLKAVPYEADGIVPFVANSPLMHFLYRLPAGEYAQHMNREGQLVPANREWHRRNGTYLFAYGLGTVIVLFGILIALHPVFPKVATLGSVLVIFMSMSTLSFLVTTPECWVPAIGAERHGFPYLAGPGRLVIKDAIMLGAAIVTMADSARASLSKTHTSS